MATATKVADIKGADPEDDLVVGVDAAGGYHLFAWGPKPGKYFEVVNVTFPSLYAATRAGEEILGARS